MKAVSRKSTSVALVMTVECGCGFMCCISPSTLLEQHESPAIIPVQKTVNNAALLALKAIGILISEPFNLFVGDQSSAVYTFSIVHFHSFSSNVPQVVLGDLRFPAKV